MACSGSDGQPLGRECPDPYGRDALLRLVRTTLRPISRAGRSQCEITCHLPIGISRIARNAHYADDRKHLLLLAKSVKHESLGTMPNPTDRAQLHATYLSNICKRPQFS